MTDVQSPPTFEDAGDTFLGMTKTQFGLIGNIVALMSGALACLAIVLVVVVSSQRHHDFCSAINTVDSSIRVVLNKGIQQAQSELKDPNFAKYREQIKASIAQSKSFRAELFANRPC